MNVMSSLPLETLFFIIVIVILCFIFHVRYDKNISDKAPTLLTTFGIFATFFAIAFGLLQFNVTNIQDSVPALLDSLKTAFWASVFGVGGALTFKIRDIILPFYDEDYDEEFNRILIEEIRQLREDNNRLLEQSIQSQNEALKNIAQSSSDELVKALEDVIKDFNAKINEQFGENFKQLNEAVGKILVWQKQYTDYIDTSTASLNNIIFNFDKISNNLNSVVNNSDQIIKDFNVFVEQAKNFQSIADNLEKTLGNLNTQRESIQNQLTTLSNLVNQTSNNLPQIENQILGIANTMKNSNEEFHRRIGELATNTERQTGALQQGIEKALTESLTGLGGQLGAMTEKFVRDYNELSNALAQISQITRQYGR
ncbi:hypothetical protein [Moraxella canis]|uniref:MotA/TolQ/ExbB proton channel domain-containing protein n=1 Tax=Moraxella canis TaxID=90239 RepID=A0A1S9ZPQ7_9GAMM|nr:hypothetical protein [Moraxella canis]OOR85363.1 hypothetical protein B0180_00770 [Moraxella canis]WQE03619.1 hypothetical protein U0021_07675 [Moraxella canis]